MAYFINLEEAIEAGKKYVLPYRQEEWNNLIRSYANSNNDMQNHNIVILQNVINIMETLENEPTTENIIKCAKEIERKDPGFAHQVESMLFTFSKFGPTICLSLPIVRAQLDIESHPQNEMPKEVPFNAELLIENIDQIMSNIRIENNMELTDSNSRNI